MLSLKEMGHWNYPNKFCPTDWYGFLYCIQNLETNQFYIGRKQFWREGKKRSKTYGKPMPWENYMSSSKHVKDDIKLLGVDKFKFDIVDLYKTRGGLNYVEAWMQMVLECMTERLDDGITPRFYNRQVAAIRWVPKETPTDKTRNYVRNLKRRY